MKMNKKKIGIIGCGTIGSQLAEAIEQRFSDQAELLALCDNNKEKLSKLQARLATKPRQLSLDELISDCDLVVEAASAEIAYGIAKAALQQGKEVMIMSVGGILDTYKELYQLARDNNGCIYLPSGALCGLDAVNAAYMGRISKAVLTTRKPPKGLEGAPYLKEKNIDLNNIREETVIFEGTAQEAIRGFPKNVNVCAALSLAGIGAERTKVKIITSPGYTANIHEIEVEGNFGKLVARTENVPSPANPKTSFLASLSAIATLKDVLDVVKIGT